MRKPKSPLAAWIVEQRVRRGWKSEELARRLGVSDSTVRGWEAGRSVSDANVTALERLFGVTAPGRTETDQSDLIGALREQTSAIRDLVAEMQVQSERQAGWNEGLAVVAARILQAFEAR